MRYEHWKVSNSIFFPLITVARITEFDNPLCGQGRGSSQRQLVECESVESLWKAAWQFCHMSFVPAILGIALLGLPTKWGGSDILICFSLIKSEVEYFFTCLLEISDCWVPWTSSIVDFSSKESSLGFSPKLLLWGGRNDYSSADGTGLVE